MATVTLELDDDVYKKLQSQAEAAGVSVFNYVAEMISERAGGYENEAHEAAEFARAHLARYPLLFKRLAE